MLTGVCFSLVAFIALNFICLFTSEEAAAASFDCADVELSKRDEVTATGVNLEVKDLLTGDMPCNPDFSYDVTALAATDGFVALVRTMLSWTGEL